MIKNFILIIFTFLCFQVIGQGKIAGTIKSDGIPLEFVSVGIIELGISSMSDSEGKFILDNIPFGTHKIKFSHIAIKDSIIFTSIKSRVPQRVIEVNLTSNTKQLDDFVVTGTRTEKRKTESRKSIKYCTVSRYI